MMKISEKKYGMKRMTNVTRLLNLQQQINISVWMHSKQLLQNFLDSTPKRMLPMRCLLKNTTTMC
jgi:hypothetical protein